MGNIIEKILIILMLAAAFFIGAFAAKAYSAELPPELAFLADLPVLAQGVCTEKATGKPYACEYRVNMETGDSYLIVWNGEELFEVVKSDAAGNFETIFKTAKKLRL